MKQLSMLLAAVCASDIPQETLTVDLTQGTAVNKANFLMDTSLNKRSSEQGNASPWSFLTNMLFGAGK
jgi:hypothetical protein